MQKNNLYFSLCFFILLFSARVNAQSIFISEAQKISTELIGYDVLGKTKNGDVLIYKKYRFEDQIDVFDKEMVLRKHKDITIKNMDYETVEVVKAGNDVFHFYTHKDNKMNYLYVQKFNDDVEKKGDPVLLDSTSLKISENFTEFKIEATSVNQWFMIYKYELSGGRLDNLFIHIMNGALAITQENTIHLPDLKFNPIAIEQMITESGKAVFLFQNDDFECKKEKAETQYVFVLPQGGNQFITSLIQSTEYCFVEMNFAIDNASQNMICMSFLKEDNKDYMIGYNFTVTDLGTGGMITNYNYIFPQETLDEIAGLAKEKSIKNLPVYQIGHIIPRVDGGALMVAEYYDKTVENYEYTNYDPYYGYRTSTRQVEFYEYDDIILFSIKNDGTPSWHNVIRKKQISREDRGVYSSYAIVKAKQELIFIFNEDVEQNSNVLQYEAEADGTLDRKSLFNANQQELQPRPASAEQISYNEVIIPSIYKKTLAFVKLAF